MKINRTLFAAAALLLLGACNAGWHLAAAPWARPTAAGGNAAVYFALHNATGHDDALLSASSDVAAAGEIHQSMEVSSGDMGSHQAAGGAEQSDLGSARPEHDRQHGPRRAHRYC
jgi:copper(I)-binding protein